MVATEPACNPCVSLAAGRKRVPTIGACAADPNWTIVEGFPLGAPANAALYGTRRTSRYLSLETQVAEAVSAAHGEVPDAKPHQTEVRMARMPS